MSRAFCNILQRFCSLRPGPELTFLMKFTGSSLLHCYMRQLSSSRAGV